MYAQVSRIATHPGKIDDVMAVLHAHGLPALTETLGFAGGLWLYDAETLRGMQVAFWEQEADIARLAENGTGAETGKMLEPLMAEMQPPETFTVLHREEMPGMEGAAYAVVVVPPIRPGAQEVAIAAWRAAVLPVLKEQEGYTGTAMLLDPAAQQVMDISLWTSDAAIQAAAQRSDLQRATERLASYLVGEPTAHRYQVMHQEGAPQHRVEAVAEPLAIETAPTPMV